MHALGERPAADGVGYQPLEEYVRQEAEHQLSMFSGPRRDETLRNMRAQAARILRPRS
jgi:hypothetical protein